MTSFVRSNSNWIFLAMLPSMLLAQPTQNPLLSRDGGGVKPNIMVTMDDSGSMMFQHMPEEQLFLDGYANAFAVPIAGMGGISVRMHPSDTFTLGGPGSAQGVASQFIGAIAGRPTSTNWRQKFMRSPDTNTIYYSPEVRYLPWALATFPLPAATATNPAGRMRNSVVTAAFLDPNNPGGTTVNLTSIGNVNSRWCFRDNATTTCQADGDSSSISYDPGLFYRLQKDATGKFKDPTVETNYTQYSINTPPAGGMYPKVAARTDCSGAVGNAGCTQAEERANFANWFSYYRTRNFLARGSLVEAFAESENTFRLGWGRINSGTMSIDGVNTGVIRQGIREFTSTHKSNFFDFLYTLPANGGTPLTGAMWAVGSYYSRTDTKGPWTDSPGSTNTANTEKSCRRSYQIMVTDGYWSGNAPTAVGNYDAQDGPSITATGRTYQYLKSYPYQDTTSNTLADYAMYFWNRDLQPNISNNIPPSAENPAFWQHMVNFTVGLGVRGSLRLDKLPGGLPNPNSDLPALTLGTATGGKLWGSDKIDDLWHAAVNSRGQFISAKDPTELASAIRESVGQALKRELREAGVATASTVLQAGNRKYVPLYRTGEWRGDIQAYVLDANGQAGAQMWTAESRMPSHSGRKIYVWDPDTNSAKVFDSTLSGTNLTRLTAPSTTPASTKTDLINFIRGDRSLEGDGKAFRERVGVLGDFINSNPVLVRDGVKLPYTNLPSIGASYASFLTQKAARTPVLFAGGNDGMLHAFKDTLGTVSSGANDGQEVFAYIPSAVIPNLSKLSDKVYGSNTLYHQFFVDGMLSETDAYINGPGATTASWRNYLLGSLGSGGRAVFALDVTDTASLGANNIRWEISGGTYPDLGYVAAPIQAGVLPNGTWVAVFGNGPYSTNGKAVLFVVNLQTGAVQTLVADGSSGNGLGGVAVVRDAQGQITSLYAGDLKGKLWKFNYSASATSGFEIEGGNAIFAATDSLGNSQPITQAPAVFAHSKGGNILMVGTGVLNTETDADSTAVQSVYGVWDKPSDPVSRPMSRSQLVSRTLSSTVVSGNTYYTLSGSGIDWDSTSVIQRGWYIDLSVLAGTRVVYPLQAIASDLALVSAVTPARSVVVCDSATGSGMNLLLPPETGMNPTFKLFDTNNDGTINSSDVSVAGYGTNADGIDVVVSGQETCVGTVCTTKLSIQNTTSQQSAQYQRQNNTTGARNIQDRLWRRIIVPPIK